MTFGIEVRNAEGDLGLDGGYKLHNLVYSGSVTLSTSSVTTTSFPSAITSQEPPLVAVKFNTPAYSMVYYARVNGTPGNWTGITWLLNLCIPGSSTDSALVYYRVYATDWASPTDVFGLRVLDASGGLVFTAATQPPMFSAYVNAGTTGTINGSYSLVGHYTLFARYTLTVVGAYDPQKSWYVVNAAQGLFLRNLIYKIGANQYSFTAQVRMAPRWDGNNFQICCMYTTNDYISSTPTYVAGTPFYSIPIITDP